MEATPPSPPPGGDYGAPAPPPQPGHGQSPYPQTPQGGGKLDTAAVFDTGFQLYGSQFLVFIGTALIVFIPVGLLAGLAAASGSAGLIIVALLIGVVAQALYTGSVVLAVQDMRDGRRDFNVFDLLKGAAPFALTLILAGILYVLGAVLSLVGLIVGAFVFLTWFSLIAPAIVVEKRGVFDSFSRSIELVRGNAWRVFGVLLVTVIVSNVLGSVIGRLGRAVGDDFVGGLIGSIVGSIVTAPITALAASVLYFHLRDLKEGTRGLAAPAPPPQV